MHIVIRRVRSIDYAEELYDLQSKCLPSDTPCAVEVGDWWIAFDDETPIAFGCLAASYRFDDCGYLARAGTLPAYRGLGIQKKLIRLRMRRAKALGYKWVFSDTRHNPPSDNALITCGFKLYQPKKPYALSCALYWRKAVSHHV